MKKLIFSTLIVLFVCSCNESYIDNLNHKTEISSVQNFTYSLVDADYGAIIKINEAKNYAQVNDTAAFNIIGKQKYFINETTAKTYLPFFLKYRMPYLSEGSLVTLVFNIYNSIDSIINIDSLTFRRMASMQWMPTIYYLIEPFSNSLGDFTIDNVSLPEELDKVWTQTADYGKATAFVNPIKYTSESYLISPSLDFSEAINPVLSFEQASKYLNSSSDSLTYKELLAKKYLVLISTDYVNNAQTAHWKNVPYLKDNNKEYIVPDGSNWNFVPTGNLDLSSAIGASNVRIAFRYISDTLAAGTWEIKNVEIKEDW